MYLTPNHFSIDCPFIFHEWRSNLRGISFSFPSIVVRLLDIACLSMQIGESFAFNATMATLQDNAYHLFAATARFTRLDMICSANAPAAYTRACVQIKLTDRHAEWKIEGGTRQDERHGRNVPYAPCYVSLSCLVWFIVIVNDPVYLTIMRSRSSYVSLPLVQRSHDSSWSVESFHEEFVERGWVVQRVSILWFNNETCLEQRWQVLCFLALLFCWPRKHTFRCDKGIHGEENRMIVGDVGCDVINGNGAKWGKQLFNEYGLVK